MVPKDKNKAYNKADYYASPETYECNFATKV